MNQGQSSLTAAALLGEIKPEHPFKTKISSAAYEKVSRELDAGRTLVVLDSGWLAGSEDLISKYIESVGKSVFVARISASSKKEIQGLRELVKPIGVEPSRLGFADLENVFSRFLAFQDKRQRRSLVVVEETGDNAAWVQRRISRMLDLDKDGKLGLQIILKRSARFNELADEPKLERDLEKRATRVSLVPFNEIDSRKFIRWRIDAAESADIGLILDYQAITLIHELAEGIPDGVEALCCAALELADQEDVAPVTTDVVVRASRSLGFAVESDRSDSQGQENAASLLDNIPTLPVPTLPRVIVSYKGKKQREFEVEKTRYTIGRAIENDICIESPFVSRKHAAILRDGVSTAVIDLESQNGTYVNSKKIRAHTLTHYDEIKLGYHTIRFLEPDSPKRVALSGAGSRRSPQVRYMASSAGAAGTSANALRTTLGKPD